MLNFHWLIIIHIQTLNFKHEAWLEIYQLSMTEICHNIYGFSLLSFRKQAKKGFINLTDVYVMQDLKREKK